MTGACRLVTCADAPRVAVRPQAADLRKRLTDPAADSPDLRRCDDSPPSHFTKVPCAHVVLTARLAGLWRWNG